MQMSPFMIGGFMAGLSISERDAGFAAFLEFLTLAVTAIALAPILPRLPYRLVGLAAVVLALLAQSISIFSAHSGRRRRGSALGRVALYRRLPRAPPDPVSAPLGSTSSDRRGQRGAADTS